MSGVNVSFVQVYLYRRRGDGEMEYLVLRRAEDEELYPGLWQMVTGRIEEGESASAAAHRELFEETGVIAVQLDVVPYVASFYFEPDDSIHHVPVFAAEVSSDTEVRISSEHSACEWLCFDDARRRLVFPGHREGLRILQEYVLHA